MTTTVQTPPDDAELAALTDEIREYVRGPGEAWALRIERERAVPAELWDELNELGYLRLAAPLEYGGRGIAFTRYLPLLELFAMSHAALRMIVHVCNGVWRSMDSHASDAQREKFVVGQIAGEIKVAFTLTEPTAGTGADLRCSVSRDGDTYYLSGEKHMITFGTISDYLLLFARVEGTRGADGTVALLVPPRGEGVTATVMGESMGVRGSDHSRRRPCAGAGRQPPRGGGGGPRRRAVGVSHPQPDRGRDDLRRPGQARVGARRRLRDAPRDVRQAARRTPGDLVHAR
jgi:alkylation response protein AidB-like acyl-CoA dehydrogenase